MSVDPTVTFGETNVKKNLIKLKKKKQLVNE